MLVIPGYLVGFGCLFLITQRTFLAFFSESKAVTIQINNYGEQYLDLVSLAFLWTICIIGLYVLYAWIKTEKSEHPFISDIRGKTVLNERGLYLGVLRDSVIDKETGSLVSILVEPSAKLQYNDLYRDDNGRLVFSNESIKSVDEVVIIKG